MQTFSLNRTDFVLAEILRKFADVMTIRRKALIGSLLLLAVGGLTVLYLYDPMSGEFPYPRCLFKQATGLDCAGCGSARALHALCHGRIADAWAVNPAVFFALPLVALAFTAEMQPKSLLRKIILSTPAIIAMLAAIILWTILRNL